MLIYLSGAIEYAPDKGKSWRSSLTPWLRALGHEVYDPAADERKNLDEDEMRNFRAWKRTDLARFRQTVRKIIAWDMDWVEHRADCVIIFWDQYATQGGGSGAEITLAHRRGIPVYLVAGMATEKISGWILGCATEVFNDFEQLRGFLATQAKIQHRDTETQRQMSSGI